MADSVQSLFDVMPAPKSLDEIPDDVRLINDRLKNRKDKVVAASKEILSNARKIKAEKQERALQQLKQLFGEADSPIHSFN